MLDNMDSEVKDIQLETDNIQLTILYTKKLKCSIT